MVRKYNTTLQQRSSLLSLLKRQIEVKHIVPIALLSVVAVVAGYNIVLRTLTAKAVEAAAQSGNDLSKLSPAQRREAMLNHPRYVAAMDKIRACKMDLAQELIREGRTTGYKLLNDAKGNAPSNVEATSRAK